jgi:hypothetical protein
MSTPLNFNFDATQVEPNAPQELIPAGWHKARMSASEWKQAKNNDKNWFVACKFTLIGEHDGAVLTDRINLANDNAMAVEIGQRTLSAICHATGIMVVWDMAQFYGIPLMIKVAVRPAGKGADGNDYAASNEIKGYKAVEEANVAFGGGSFPAGPPVGAVPAPAVAAQAPAQAPAAAAPAAARPPFGNSAGAAAAGPGPGAQAGPAPSGKAPWAK